MYSVIKHKSKFYFNYSDSPLFDVSVYYYSHVQFIVDYSMETIEINFSTKNQRMRLIYENEEFEAFCYGSHNNEKYSESISNMAKTIFNNFIAKIVKDISMSEMNSTMIEMFNEAKLIVPTFEELDQ
jgi:uncharacterized ubiquitin-like protein YukD